MQNTRSISDKIPINFREQKLRRKNDLNTIPFTETNFYELSLNYVLFLKQLYQKLAFCTGNLDAAIQLGI